jgi:hypothetical protein
MRTTYSLSSGAEHFAGCFCRRKQCGYRDPRLSLHALETLLSMPDSHVEYRGRRLFVRAPRAAGEKPLFIEVAATPATLNAVEQHKQHVPLRVKYPNRRAERTTQE